MRHIATCINSMHPQKYHGNIMSTCATFGREAERYGEKEHSEGPGYVK